MSRRPTPRLSSMLATFALVVAGLLLPAQSWSAPPSAPAAPTLATDQQSLTATWAAPVDGAVSTYLVRVLDGGGDEAAFAEVPADTLAHTFSGLDNGSYTATVTALGPDGASPESAASAARPVAVETVARWSLGDLPSTTDGTVVPDSSGNGNAATIRGAGATSVTAPGGDGLALPGGANNSGAYVELPTGFVDGRDTLTVSTWLRNETGSGNYAAFFLGAAQSPPARYVLLNPKNPAGRFKSVLTTGTVSAGSPWTTETGISPTDAARGIPGPVTSAEWGLYTTVITASSITGYYNGQKIGTVAHSTLLSTFGTGLKGYLGRSSYADPTYRGGIRDVRVYGAALTDATVAALWAEDQVRLDRAALDLPSTTLVDLDLPTAGVRGSQVRWTSSAPSVISPTGAVTRPSVDTTVTLTATLAKGGKALGRTFEVLVPADDPAGDVARVSEAFDLRISRVFDDVVLRTTVDGVDVSWSSSAPDVLDTTGQVTRPADDTTVTLTAVFSRGGATGTRTYDVVVAAADAGRVATYIRTGNENRTDALHLGYAEGDSTSYSALHDNRPVLYGPDPQTRLGAPVAFRRPDGGFGLLSVVDSNSPTAWVWDSEDLVRFTNPRSLTLPQGLSTTAMAVRYDNGIGAYRLGFTSGGTTYEVRTADFADLSAAVAGGTAPTPATGTFPAGALEPSAIGVTPDEATRLRQKFTRMTSTGTRPLGPVTVQQGDDLDLPGTAEVTYSNGGSDTTMPVTWDADDVAAVDTGTPGTYTVDGQVERPTYPDTIGVKRADPDVTLADDGYYYMTASYPDAPGAPGYDRINLRRSRTIAGLADAPETTVWHENTSSALNRYIWAPELTKIGDSYYLMFTAARSGGVFDIRPAILEHTGGDLLDPASWQELGYMKAAAGDSAFSSFSLDMTHFEHGGKDYVVWAEKPGPSQLRIATVDTANPQQLTSPSRVIATPDTAWEVNLAQNQYVDEGAAVIERDGRMLMTFSGSTVDDRYSIGLLSADADSDLLDPAAWRKTSYPLLVTADLPAGQSGPGHNSFTTDAYGNDVIVYHSRDLASTTDGGLSDPSRWARARTVHYDVDGDPVLTMTPEEELRPQDAAVRVTVVVEPEPMTPTPPTTPTTTPSTPSTPTPTGPIPPAGFDPVPARIGTSLARPLVVGRRGTLRVTVRAAGVVPSGTLRVRLRGLGEQQTWRRSLDARGRTTIRLPRFERSGKVTLWIAYRGDDSVHAERKRIRLPVRPARGPRSTPSL